MTKFPHIYQVDVDWKGAREGIISAAPRPNIPGGAPPEFGGGDKVWSPEHLLLSSIGLCLMLTFLALAEKAKLKVDGYQSKVDGELDKTTEGLIFTEITVGVQARTAEPEKTASLLHSAKKYCIVTNCLKTPVTLIIC